MKNISVKLIAVCAIMLFHVMSVSGQTVKKHIIDRGETLASIASLYGVTQEEIIQLNPDAARFVYVGMELSIPIVSINAEKQHNEIVPYPTNDVHTNRTPTIHIASNNSDSFEKNRNSLLWEIGYSASSFDDVKLSGSYGFSGTILPWKLVNRLYIGIHFSALNFNFGLVDSEYASCDIKFGPALGYYFTETTFVSMPINIVCNVNPEGKSDKTRTAWGMQVSPSIYLGKNFGIYIGPQLTIGFSEGSKANIGFKAGVYF